MGSLRILRIVLLLGICPALALAEEQTLCEHWFHQVFPGHSSNNFIFKPQVGKRIAREEPAPNALPATDPSFANNIHTSVEPFPAGASLRLESGKLVAYGETYPAKNSFTGVYEAGREELLAKIPQGQTRATIDKNSGLIIRDGDEGVIYKKAYSKNDNKYHYLESSYEYRKDKRFESFEHSGEPFRRIQVGEEFFFVEEKSEAPFLDILNTSTTIPGLHFSKEAEGKFHLEELMPLDKIAGRAKAVPPPSAEEFAKLYPHSADFSRTQTRLEIEEYGTKKSFFLKSYDPATGEVTAERERFRILRGTPLLEYPGLDKKTYLLDLLDEDYPAITVRGYQYRIQKESSSPTMLYARADSRYADNIQIPIKPNGKIYFHGIEQEMHDLKPGMTVDLAGTTYEVRSVNEREMGKLVLRAPEQLKMSWEQFAAYAETGHVETSIATQPITTALKPGGTSSLVDRILGRQREKVPLVGSGRRKRIQTQIAPLSEFESKKTEADPYRYLHDLHDGKYPAGTKVQMRYYDDSWRNTKVDKAVGDNYFKWDIEHALRKGRRFEEILIEPPGQAPVHIEFQRVKSGERTLEKYFDVSPVKGKVITYEVNGLHGPKNVSVAFPLSDSAIKNVRLGRMADDIVAKLPLAHADANTVILLETGEYELNASGLAFQSVKGENGNVIRKTTLTRHVIDRPSPFYRIKTLWHETGHQIAEKIWNASHNPGEEWARAVALDGKFVSGYSLHQYQWRQGKSDYDLVEDMAEAVTAYISTDGGRWNPKLREQFKYRFGLLDRIMQAEDIQAFARQTLLQRAAAAGLTASAVTAAGAGVWYWEENKPPAPMKPAAPVAPGARVMPNGVPLYGDDPIPPYMNGKRRRNY